MWQRSFSNRSTRSRERRGLIIPSCSTGQAISHTRHPVHFSGSIRKIALLVLGMNNLMAVGYKVAILYLEKLVQFNEKKEPETSLRF